MTTPRARAYAFFLSFLIVFCALANGGHDLWAATTVYLAVLGLGLALVFELCWSERASGIFPDFLASLAVVAAAFTLSFRQSVHPEESWLALMDWLAAMLVFLIARHVLREKRALEAVLVAAVPLACLELAVILYQHWVLVSPEVGRLARGALVRYALSLQVPGTLVNSSVATAFFVLWAPVLASLALEKRRQRRRSAWFWAAGAVAVILGVVSLKSTWGMICLAGAAPWLWGPRPLGRWIGQRPRLAATAAAAALVIVAATLFWKFGHVYNLTGDLMRPGETTRRLYWWASGLEMFRDHPWLGVGIGNFPSAYRAYKIGSVQNTLYAHNLVVGLLAETGVVGAASVAAFLLWGLLRLSRAKGEVAARWPFLLGLMTFALFGAIGLSLEYFANLVSCGLFLGILVAPLPERAWKPSRSLLIVFAALCLSAVPWLLSPFLASRACVSAQQALLSGDVFSAAKEFAAAAETDPRSSDARSGWARALRARYASTHDPKDLAAAVVRQQEAARLNRLQGTLWWELGNLQREQGESVRALESYETAARLRP